MSKATRRINALMRHDPKFRKFLSREIKQNLSRRRYGHVLSEAAHYLTRAAQYRQEGRIDVAKSYVAGARKILTSGTSWGNVINLPRVPLPK